MQKPRPASRGSAARRGRGRPKLKSDREQRASIVEGARALFARKGYGRTTMEDVATHCRVSKRTLYELFAGKAALFSAIVDAHRLEMLALPGDYDHLPLTEALAQIFRVDVDAKASERRIDTMQLIMLESRQLPELARVTRRRGPEMAIGLLADWLDRQRDRGRISIDDTAAAAKVLMDMIFGAVAVKSGSGLDWPGAKDRNAYVRRCINIFVNGVGTPKTKAEETPARLHPAQNLVRRTARVAKKASHRN